MSTELVLLEEQWMQKEPLGKMPDLNECYVAEAGPQRSSWATRTPRAARKGWH